MYRPLPWRDLDNPRLPPPRTSIAGTLKPHPPVFLAPGPVLGAQQFRSRPHPRARPCPRSLNVSISCFPSFFDPVHPIRPTLPVAHTIIPPCIALQRSQSPPPPTTHLASSGPTRRSVQAAAEAHRPDLATRRSGEFRTAPSPKTPPHQQPGRHLRRPSAAFPQARAQEERRSPPR